ncbi:tRNA 2'-phosphotransferase, putative [Candida maltosa Xu316]|uniref:2'-phosphotransferase n=1 Tax=Candida maltosa (strain Xu316) TaxID=1245528 RepID=M3IGE0_CANMX|nr:tRNA 2'-phosphotransferase, putative [Candida maltosa Xu316]
MSSSTLSAYRGVLRAIRFTFRGDTPILQNAVQELKRQTLENSNLKTQEEIDQGIEKLNGVSRFIISNLVQGEKQDDGKYFLNFHDKTELGDNETIKQEWKSYPTIHHHFHSMPPPDPARRDVLISKALSYLLRHGAQKEKLTIDEQGYVKISDILSHQRLKSYKTTRTDLERIVRENDKKRFTIKDDEYICANQGHSLKVVKNENLTPMTVDELKKLNVYHGTYKNKLSVIKNSGGLYVDVEKCVAANIQFYKSLNNVILSSGDETGKISWDLIEKIVDLQGNEINKNDI